jgi:TolB protein
VIRLSTRPETRRPLPVLGLLAAVVLALVPLGACDEKILVDIDRSPPVVVITTPTAETDVSGVSFLINVDASDDVGVEGVSFRVNSGPPFLDSTSPFSLRVITLAESAGTELDIRVEASDAAGNSAEASVVATVAARTVTRVTSDPADDMDPSWSPDGTRIAFQADRDGSHFDLWVMDSDGANEQRLTTNVNEDRNPAWSPNGEWIAFDSDRSVNFDIWRLPVATGELGALAVTTGNQDDIEPAWTPDGLSLYFSSSRGTSGTFNLWRQPVPGIDAQAVSVTALNAEDRAPAVSPDGETLVFSSELTFASPHIFTRDVDAPGVEPLTGDTGFTEFDPAWSPGGEAILFARSEGTDSNLWVVPNGGTNPIQVTFGAGVVGDGGPAWSPDGRKVAFHSDRDGNLDIWVME